VHENGNTYALKQSADAVKEQKKFGDEIRHQKPIFDIIEDFMSSCARVGKLTYCKNQQRSRSRAEKI
jgi:hypothetical protein